MFTAIVLVCSGLNKNPQECYTYTLEYPVSTYDQCLTAIEYAMKNKIFDYYDESKNELHQVRDFYCVNWKAERT